MRESTDILIVGGGLVGASLALAFEAAGREAMLVDAVSPRPVPSPAPPAGDDNDRNLVLARASVNALGRLGVWTRLEPAAGTIGSLEISRAGEFGRVRIAAAEAGLDSLGRVVPGRILGAALEARLAACRHVQRRAPATLVSLALGLESVRARIATGGDELEVEARLVVGADGSESRVRAQAGIGARSHDYRQSLFVSTVACGRDIPERAFERFSDRGPVALLPLPRQRRGLVLTVEADRHDEVVAMDDKAFLELAQQRFGWKLGVLSRPGRRFAHRIQRVLADSLTAARVIVIGNAAQTVHPIGAQGFNLGLRDALTLAELVAGAADPGAAQHLDEYAARRRPDRDGVVAFSHSLVALACLAEPALAPLRTLTLAAFDRVPALHRALALRGMGFRGLPPAATLETGP